MNKELVNYIALTLIPKIGHIGAKKLIAHCGGAAAVFSEKQSLLEKVPGVGTFIANSIIKHKKEAFIMAEKELLFIEKNNINAFCLKDNAYPKRLTFCEDGPLVVYTRGNIDLNKQKIISIVGTRKATDYGIDFCNKLIEDLAVFNPLIVSGLAYGIDVCAHKASINNNLPTVGVLAHGLNQLYPSQHRGVADKMLLNGGLLTEFLSFNKPDRENFPKRNRVVAGLADATIVIESSKKGGSLITAEIANNYNRDVFAVPGKVTDNNSVGCNNLIKQHKAHLLQSAKDVEYIMGWERKNLDNKIKQISLFTDLNEEELMIVKCLKKHEKLSVDQIALNNSFSVSKTSTILLNLEFKNVAKSLPGNLYKLIV